MVVCSLDDPAGTWHLYNVASTSSLTNKEGDKIQTTLRTGEHTRSLIIASALVQNDLVEFDNLVISHVARMIQVR